MLCNKRRGTGRLPLKWLLAWALFFCLAQAPDARAEDYDIRVSGSVQETVDFWEGLDFWGAEDHDKDLLVPRAYVVVTNPNWKAESDSIPVAVKKELFYRAAVPLIVFANEEILRERGKLEALATRHRNGESLSADDTSSLQALAQRYGLGGEKGSGALPQTAIERGALIDELLLRIDIIPPALALGQAAYESGYGTSRFAREGNAYFGQWTWGEKGMRPLSQRKELGDYKIATYDWPLDSVRGYMLNLNTQRTYAELRALRAELRRRGEEMSGLALAGGLTNYSERGETYVETLRGMIRTNELFIADNARLRDGPTILLVAAEDAADKAALEKEIEALRASGELERIIATMGLEATN